MVSTFVYIMVLVLTLVSVSYGTEFSDENDSAKSENQSSNNVEKKTEIKKPVSYFKPFSSNHYYEGSKGKYGIWINDNKWLKGKLGINADAEYEFEHINGDAHAVILYSKSELTIEKLRELALANARSAALNAKSVFEEERIVNGVEILCLQINGTINTTPFTYYGYYYTGRNGTLQAIAFTRQNLFAEYKRDFEDLLNGLEIKK
ncbi:MAG: hypothetical protein V3V99_03570 [candidate division Zixibacteria bacterium]